MCPSLPLQGENNIIKHSNRSTQLPPFWIPKNPIRVDLSKSSPRHTRTALTLVGIQRVVVWNHTALHHACATRMTQKQPFFLRSRESKNRTRTLMNHKNPRHFKQTRSVWTTLQQKQQNNSKNPKKEYTLEQWSFRRKKFVFPTELPFFFSKWICWDGNKRQTWTSDSISSMLTVIDRFQDKSLAYRTCNC